MDQELTSHALGRLAASNERRTDMINDVTAVIILNRWRT